jgi:hypothetical protein
LLCVVVGLSVASRCVSAWAFDWDYSAFRFDLTEAAVLGSARDVREWQEAPRQHFREQAAAVGGGPARLVSSTVTTKGGVTRKEAVVKFPGVTDSGQDLDYHVVILAPEKPAGSPQWPVVTLDGHGDVNGEGSGRAPKRMFAPGGFALGLVEQGYTVIGIPTAVHKPFEQMAARIDYTVIWAKLARDALEILRSQLPGSGRYHLAGNAIGGLTALSLAIIDDGALALFVNGAFFPLELTRREYRVKDHPLCHDYRAFNTYTAVYALLAPRPLMITMGRQDALWLGHRSAPASDWFSGMKRGATVDETLGSFLVLDRIWRKFHAPIRLDVHQGQHEDIDSKAAGHFFRRAVAAGGTIKRGR